MTPLDPFNLNLNASTLIEASAGTGKTHTIATLYCRLLAEGHRVESILVVTFTEAAAAELSLRIRQRISLALNRLSECFIPEPAGGMERTAAPGRADKTTDELIAFLMRQANPQIIQKRFRLALACFDQAAIMTIHSFCLRILKENAFESRSLFDIKLMPDRSAFLLKVACDFFSARVDHLDPLLLKFFETRKVSPESFAHMFKTVVSRPGILIQPYIDPFEMNLNHYRELLEKLKHILDRKTEEIGALILSHPGIDKRRYQKQRVLSWLVEIRIKLDQEKENALFDPISDKDHLHRFTRTRILNCIKPGHPVLNHEFFDLCEQVQDFYHGFEKYLIRLKMDFLSFFDAELEKMKKIQGMCFFDDLINDVFEALKNDENQLLNRSIRQIFSACLIDEFQDTDPIQYDIFSKLFLTPETPFFMIGDPKQAIYGFRGGDIFAYLKASGQCDQKFTLKKNYRSSPLLVKAVNRIFCLNPSPFVYPDITFSEVDTPELARNLLMGEDGVPEPPFQFCFVKRDDMALLDAEGFISTEALAKQIPQVVAEDILSLITSGKTLLDRKDEAARPKPVSPGDIAVLVRTNEQADQIKTALSFRNIPSHLSKTGSVFDSGQALELYDILYAVYHAEKKDSLLAALSTSVFNYGADDIRMLCKEETLFYEWQKTFRHFKALWEEKGISNMITALLHSETAFPDNGFSPDERELTNFYHLSEIISKACLEYRFSPQSLLNWYGRQLSKTIRDESEHELRLESDKKAVTIVTLHKSKGLEYPVVYLPFLFEGQKKNATENILFHDPKRAYELTLDLGSDEIEYALGCFDTEDRAEQRRLLYVGMTRASALCRVVWGGFKAVQNSSLGFFLHPEGCAQDEVMINNIEKLMAGSENSISMFVFKPGLEPRYEIEHPEEVKLSARAVHRRVVPAWKISSFSSLSKALSHVYPESLITEGAGDISKQVTLAVFPRGAQTGDFFHSIFESLDFKLNPDDILSLVRSKALKFGFGPEDLVENACQGVKDVLATKLFKGPDGFCLKDIPKMNRICEMEFVFPVMPFDLSSLLIGCETADNPPQFQAVAKALSLLSNGMAQGFLKGFIDLVVEHKGKWYILDYKTNFLGHTYAHYSVSNMTDAMSDNHYYLQYYLYTMALHAYLQSRMGFYDYDTHFGGVCYLFIRGMHPDLGPDFGVFFDRPPKSIIAGFLKNEYSQRK